MTKFKPGESGNPLGRGSEGIQLREGLITAFASNRAVLFDYISKLTKESPKEALKLLIHLGVLPKVKELDVNAKVSTVNLADLVDGIENNE